jgi:WD40 repeat protein
MQYQDLKCIRTFEGDSQEAKAFMVGVGAIALSPDGKTLVSSSYSNKAIKIWNLETGELEKTLEGHGAMVNTIAISPNQKIIASGSVDETVKTWDFSTGKFRHTLQIYGELAKKEITCVVFSADGKYLYAGTKGANTVYWDANTGKEEGSLGLLSTGCSRIAISADGRTIAGISPGRLQVFDPPGKKRFEIEPDHTNASIAISADGETIYIGDTKSNIYLWNSRTAQEIGTLTTRSKSLKPLVVSPDGQTLVSGTLGGLIKIWDLKSLTEISAIDAHSSFLTGLIFTPDGQNLISSGDTTIKVWEFK